jgi:hypothetical protein
MLDNQCSKVLCVALLMIQCAKRHADMMLSLFSGDIGMIGQKM